MITTKVIPKTLSKTPYPSLYRNVFPKSFVDVAIFTGPETYTILSIKESARESLILNIGKQCSVGNTNGPGSDDWELFKGTITLNN